MLECEQRTWFHKRRYLGSESCPKIKQLKNDNDTFINTFKMTAAVVVDQSFYDHLINYPLSAFQGNTGVFLKMGKMGEHGTQAIQMSLYVRLRKKTATYQQLNKVTDLNLYAFLFIPLLCKSSDKYVVL